MSRRSSEKPTVLISYAHEDRVWFGKLKSHLFQVHLEEYFDLEVWDDVTEFRIPGRIDAIRNSVERFKAVIILVSPHYLTSEVLGRYGFRTFLRDAEENGAIILPVIIEPSDFSATYLSQFQSVNDPNRPLNVLSVTEQERILNNVVRIILEKSLEKSRISIEDALESASARASVSIPFPIDLEPSGLIRMLRNAFIGLVIVGFVVSLSWLAPRIGSRLVGGKGPSDIQQAEVPTFLQGDVPDGKHKNISGTLSVRIPKAAKISETFPVQAEFQPDSKYLYRLSTDLKLESPSFKITSASTPGLIGFGEEFKWAWLILPEKTGRHAISLRFDPEVEYKIDESRRPFDFQVSSKSIIAYVTVLTDLNLTSTQDAMMKVFGAVIGIVGTILGYPFLKRYFEKKNDPAKLNRVRNLRERRSDDGKWKIALPSALRLLSSAF